MGPCEVRFSSSDSDSSAACSVAVEDTVVDTPGRIVVVSGIEGIVAVAAAEAWFAGTVDIGGTAADTAGIAGTVASFVGTRSHAVVVVGTAGTVGTVGTVGKAVDGVRFGNDAILYSVPDFEVVVGGESAAGWMP